jgi:PKD repeat protein
MIQTGMMITWLSLWFCAVLFAGPTSGRSATSTDRIECWGIFDISLAGPSSGNPFVDVHLSARFQQGNKVVTPEGFYDGDGVYRVRFMPDSPGQWTYVTKSNCEELDGKKGAFTCVAPAPDNHGPVRVHNTFQLAYADGTPHFSVGTTCYAWAHQGDAREEQTLATLKNAPFNKMRMCVFPKSYAYNRNEPQYYPYEGKPLKHWDFTRFNPAFWRHFEKRVGQLRDMGIEADIIIFHPYDRWGFKDMGHESNLFYLRYLVARLAAYRNVWWSFANEYDLLKWPVEHWDQYMKLVQEIDPYNHLRGIHNCRDWYDHSKPWVTHCSIQNSDFAKAKEYRDRHRKPVVYDECRYEGDIPQGWGNITAEQMTRNFWMGSLAGCYVGHGETYKHPEDLLWWAKGGVLRGQSPARIQFMKDIIEQLPYQEMPPDFSHHPAVCIMSKPGDCYLMYFAEKKSVTLDLPGGPYKIDTIDPWEMKVLPVGSAGPGRFSFAPPKQDYAIRLTRYAPGEKARPAAQATADKIEGIAPLTVRFSTPWKQQCRWDFGDAGGSAENSPTHTFERPGIYTVVLTVTDSNGASGSATLPISVDRRSDEPVVRFGFAEGDRPRVTLHGDEITKASDGAYDLGSEAPFSWIKVGEGPIADLEGARSFTVMGWLKASGMQVGSGGNRILFSLQHSHSGIDIVHHADGRMRLAVNEWPDNIQNDSSPGRLAVGKWVFFAVTYDATKSNDSVCWYFGDEDTPAQLDRRTDYNNGPVDEGGGDLVVGNFNKTLQGAGLDRQFRGQIRGLQIYASRIGTRGALPLEKIRERQKDR